ncbi:chemotaxis protein CheW [Azospira sp. APE16]|uniref:chemotaxis protein CheW n=1 Tax=Azospira sp. APE16 TaxID=3394231 RepID=UPI003A4D94A0
MAIDMSQFYQVFFEESAEHLAEMESLLLGLDVGAPEDEDLNAIFRAAHSIKGSSGTFGFTDLTAVTHVLETLLDRLRKHEIGLRPEMVDAFLEAGDLLKLLLAAHQGGEAVSAEAQEAICEKLRQLSRDEGAGAVAAVVPETVVAPAESSVDGGWEIEFVPTPASLAVPETLENFLEDLGRQGRLEVLSRSSGPVPSLWQLRLYGQVARESLADSLDFVAETDAWRLSPLAAPAAAADEAFGLFDDAPGAPQDETAYGFFDDAPGLAPAAPAAMAEEGDGYGFFDPLPEPVAAEDALAPIPAVAEEGEGYGFFAPLPDPAAAPAAVAEEGDGYGFFEPLPANAGAAAGVAEPPVLEEGEGYGFFVPLPQAGTMPAVSEPAPAPLASPPAAPAVAPTSVAAAAPAPLAPAAEARVESRPKAPPVAAGDSSIRVGVEKVDQLINLVGELVITQAMLLATAQEMQEAAPERLLNGLTQLERNSRDLQEAVMSIRMLPISFVFSRFPRVVRDLSGKLGKQVELKMSGETTELDKGLIEKITDPLTHLIRNSLDHGIESPEKRVAAGKPPGGTITLKAAHQGGNIVIEVGDDGAGLNRQKILAKAREKGLAASDQMSDQDVWALIFEPGFSTADQVTDVSGRGVGMDVVRRNIQALGGRIEIESMTGIGTRMTVRLPLTLAILDGMSVAVGEEIYIIPLSYVVESLQPKPSDIKTVSNQGRVIQVRGEYLPVVVLHEVFAAEPKVREFHQGIMVVLNADGAKAALFVDGLVGQHQVVIKSLEQNYRKVQGVSGATIMGDGRVALILDTSALVAMAKGQATDGAA